jgi:hypothetical protein
MHPPRLIDSLAGFLCIGNNQGRDNTRGISAGIFCAAVKPIKKSKTQGTDAHAIASTLLQLNRHFRVHFRAFWRI